MSEKATTTATARRHTAERSVLQDPRLLRGERAHASPDPRIHLIRDVLIALVRRDGRDLTARQLSAFLIVYTSDEVQTVSRLAEQLHISRPGVTRVMDRLVGFDLLARDEDPADRRRVLARRTARGTAYHQELMGIARHAAEERAELAAPQVFVPRAIRA